MHNVSRPKHWRISSLVKLIFKCSFIVGCIHWNISFVVWVIFEWLSKYAHLCDHYYFTFRYVEDDWPGYAGWGDECSQCYVEEYRMSTFHCSTPYISERDTQFIQHPSWLSERNTEKVAAGIPCQLGTYHCCSKFELTDHLKAKYIPGELTTTTSSQCWQHFNMVNTAVNVLYGVTAWALVRTHA